MNKQILLGSLMGDSNIYLSSNKYYNFSIEHSLKQEEYIKWKAKKLKIENIFYRNRLDKRTNKVYHSVSIYKCSSEFKKFYNLFYSPKKEITQEILDLLDEVSVAIWYCDDGWYYKNPKYYTHQIGIATNSFSRKSLELIVNWFKSKYNLDFKIVKNGSIRITSEKQCKQFLNIFGKYIPKCMNYKM